MVVTKVSNMLGDWEGVYFDDELLTEGHSVNWDIVMRGLLGKVVKQYVKIYDIEVVDGYQLANFPNSLKELELEMAGKHYRRIMF